MGFSFFYGMKDLVVLSELAALVNDVERRKKDTVKEWCSLFLVPKGYGYGDTGLTEKDGVPVGVIPCYWFYQTYWDLDRSDSPFDTMWSLYDLDNVDHFDFLLDVVQILNEHMVWWSTDKESVESQLFICFKGFVSSLHALIDFSCAFMDKSIRLDVVDGVDVTPWSNMGVESCDILSDVDEGIQFGTI